MTNCMNGSSQGQIYMVNLKVRTVIAIGHEVIFVFLISTKLSSIEWGLTSVDHQAYGYWYYYMIKA